VAVAAVPVTATAVLGVEVVVAARGTNLPTPATPTCGPVSSAVAPLLPLPHVVWLGDSTAAGVGASAASRSLPCQVAALGEPTQVDVLAVSGARVADVLHEQLPRMADLHPDRIFISIGANDTTHLSSTDDFRDRYRRVLDALPAGVPVVALGVPDMGAPTRLTQPLRAFAGWRGRLLDGVVRDLAKRPGVTYVDIAGPTGPAFRRDPHRYFAADRFHPSDDGYGLWAKAVLEAQRP
jgi:lysophospholipase L1-like esterase